MKALSEIKLPVPKGCDEESRRRIETNQFLINKNFRQIHDELRDQGERIKALEARYS